MLTWFPSHEDAPRRVDPEEALKATETYWREWIGKVDYAGRYRDAVVRSLITLKAMIHRPTGGIIAAPTASLPEHLGGERNWDYRYCWLRDATFTLLALLRLGLTEEAEAWIELAAPRGGRRADRRAPLLHRHRPAARDRVAGVMARRIRAVRSRCASATWRTSSSSSTSTDR